jgi:hypothetical protein
MTSELSSNAGYLALKRETTEGTAVTPDAYVPLYDESITTEMNPETETSIFGSKFARLQVTPGVRSHGGDLTVMAEPNSTGRFFDMLLTRGTITGGSSPYTWPVTASFTKPASYTVDLSTGNQVARFIGVQASEMSPSWKDNEMRWKIKVSALKSFLGAECLSLASATVTLKTPTNYPSPTDGLVAGDIVAVVAGATGARQNLTILSLTGTTVTFTTTPSAISSGDMLILRPATPSLAVLTPFLWSRTEFRFAADAATALSATHTPLEDGSEFVVQHPFDDDKGAQSSGSFDPSRLVRGKTVDFTFKAKKFFYNPDEVRTFKALTKVAVVVRMYSESGYECRVTMNNLTITKGGDKPMIKDQETEYYELEYTPIYDTSDGQGIDVKVLNNLAS